MPTSVLMANVLLVLVVMLSHSLSPFFVRSLLSKTLVGKLSLGRGIGFERGDPSAEVVLQEAAHLEQQLQRDFCYVLDLFSAYLLFPICGLAGFLARWEIGLGYSMAALVTSWAWRMVAEAGNVDDYYRRRRFCVTLHGTQIMLALLLNSSGILELMLLSYR